MEMVRTAFMTGTLSTFARWLLIAATASILLLTFVWPFAISADPADPRFRVAAIAVFVFFLAAVTILAVARLKRA